MRVKFKRRHSKSVRFQNSDLQNIAECEEKTEVVEKPEVLEKPTEETKQQPIQRPASPEQPVIPELRTEVKPEHSLYNEIREHSTGSVRFRAWLGQSTPVYCELSDSSVHVVPAKHTSRFVPRYAKLHRPKTSPCVRRQQRSPTDTLQADLGADVSVSTQLYSLNKVNRRNSPSAVTSVVEENPQLNSQRKSRCRSAPCNVTKRTMSRQVAPSHPSDGMAGRCAWGGIEEKKALQDINERFANYIGKVRQLQVIGGDDPFAARVTVQMLEQELTSLKNAYETELERCRHENLLTGMEKGKQQHEAERYKQVSAEYEVRLGSESQKNTRLLEDIGIMNARIASLERDLNDARTALSSPLQKVEHFRQQAETSERECNDLKDRVAVLSAKDSAMSMEIQHLNSKIAFQQDLALKRENELQARLETAATSILTLEKRVLDLSKTDDSIPELIRAIQEKAEQDLKVNMQQAQARHLAVTGELKDHLSSESARVKELSTTNNSLGQIRDELSSQLTSAHSRVAALEQERAQLLNCLQAERERSASRVHDVESRLSQTQELLKKMEKYSCNGRGISLKSEIDSLNCMVKEEEKRLSELHSQSLPPLLNATDSLTSQPVVPSYVPPPSTGEQHLAVGPIVHPERSPRLMAAAGRPTSCRQTNLVSTQLGTGRDYFDAMFHDLKTEEQHQQNGGVEQTEEVVREETEVVREETEDVTADVRPISSTTHDYTNCTNTNIGNIKILEVHSEGKYVRLQNLCDKTDIEIGGYMIQQNVGGRPVTVFRFPSRTKLQRAGLVTVWCGQTDPLQHQPPTDFVFTEQPKWGWGPECTTILCKPNGQAIGWSTAAHRFTSDRYQNSTPSESTPPDPSLPASELDDSPVDGDGRESSARPEQLTDSQAVKNTRTPEGLFLRRPNPPSSALLPQRHPHGESPGAAGHPRTAPGRERNGGNEGSSWHPQSRSQQLRPDPISSNPYAVGAQRHMNSGRGPRVASAANRSLRYSGVPKPDDGPELMSNEEPPSSLMPPRRRHEQGLAQLRSQHDEYRCPPMPKPPLISSW